MVTNEPDLVDPLKPETDEFIDDPYPILHRLRHQSPLWWSEAGRHWLITGYHQAHLILRDRRFIKGMRFFRHIEKTGQVIPGTETFIKARSKWMVHLDPPDHTRMRSVVNKAFAPNTVMRLSSLMKAVANRLLDEVGDTRQTELIGDLACPFVLRILCELLGIPREDHVQFGTWAQTLTQRVNAGLDLGMEHPHMSSFHTYLRNFVQECQASPKPGVISMLAHRTEDGELFTTDEVLDNCILILVAGYETTVNGIGNAVVTLLRNPKQLALLKSSPSQIKSAIDEVLRFESPVQTVSEIAATDITMEGASIKRGQNVIVMIGACNRDPLQFTDPDRFDITRTGNKHLAFGEGIHHCLGSGLAELLIGTFLTNLIERAPNLRLSHPSVEFKKPFGLRGPKFVNLEW